MDFWTPEKIDRMFLLVGAGNTMSEVARDLGTTKNAVIGKHNRLRDSRGIERPHTGPRKRTLEAAQLRNTVPKRAYKANKRPPELSGHGVGFIMPVLALVPPSRGPAVGILDVTGCKWAVGTDTAVYGSHTFCDASIEGAGSYCPYHANLNVSKAVKAPKRQFRVIPTSLLRMGAA